MDLVGRRKVKGASRCCARFLRFAHMLLRLCFQLLGFNFFESQKLNQLWILWDDVLDRGSEGILSLTFEAFALQPFSVPFVSRNLSF